MVEDDPSPTQLNRFCSQKVTILCKKTLASKYLQLQIAEVKKKLLLKITPLQERLLSTACCRRVLNIVATLSLVALLQLESTQLAVQLLWHLLRAFSLISQRRTFNVPSPVKVLSLLQSGVGTLRLFNSQKNGPKLALKIERGSRLRIAMVIA